MTEKNKVKQVIKKQQHAEELAETPGEKDGDKLINPGYIHPYYIEGKGPPYWPPPPNYPLQPEDKEALEEEEWEKYWDNYDEEKDGPFEPWVM